MAKKNQLVEKYDGPTDTDGTILKEDKSFRRRKRQIDRKDYQLPSDGSLNDQERRWKNNAKKACSNCPGFCCLAFAISVPEDGLEAEADRLLDQLLEAYEQEDRHMNLMVMRGFHYSGRTRDGERAISNLETQWYNADFFSTRLIKLTNLAPEILNSQGGGKQYHTCKEFNVAERRYMAYNDRPAICRQYLCGPSTVGRVPKVKTMMAQPKYVLGIDKIFKLQLRTKIKNERKK